MASPDTDAAHATGTHASTEAHGQGGLPQFQVEHWGGQIIYLLFLFLVLYVLMARVFAPRMRRVFDERAQTIASAVEDARNVQSEAEQQARTAREELASARASARSTAEAAKARVAADIARRQAEQEAVLEARISEAEGRIGAMRDAAMAQVETVAADTTRAVVEKLTGKAPTAAELATANGAA